MRKIGLCETCGKPANDSCQLCGRLVCTMHFDQRARLCLDCLPPSGRRQGSKKKEPPGVII